MQWGKQGRGGGFGEIDTAFLKRPSERVQSSRALGTPAFLSTHPRIKSGPARVLDRKPGLRMAGLGFSCRSDAAADGNHDVHGHDADDGDGGHNDCTAPHPRTSLGDCIFSHT
jgi:hypothetical protein